MRQPDAEEAREAEEQAYLDDGGGQPPSRDPAGSIAKVLMVMAALIFAAFVIASLASCATPATRTETVEVKVPVAVQPIKADQVPSPPAPLPPRPKSLSAAADVLLADHCQWVAFGLKAMPLLRLSAGLPPTQLAAYPECEGH